MNLTLSDVKTPVPAEATPIYYGILTDQGQALLASAIASGIPLSLTQMAVGDGAGQPVTPLPEMTELVNEVHRAALNQLFVDPTASNEIVAEMVMDEITGGFWIRELGLYDETGTLFAVANAPDSYKPVLAEGAGRALLTRMVLIVSDSSAVELIINPDTVMASRAYVDAKIAEHAASRDHPAAAEGAQGMIPLATPTMVAEGVDHSSAVTPAGAAATYAQLQHEHEIDDVLWLQEALDEKAEVDHTHTPEEAGAAPVEHGHEIADVSGLQEALDGKADVEHPHTPAEVGAAPAGYGLGTAGVAVSNLSQFIGRADAENHPGLPSHGAGWQSTYGTNRRAQIFLNPVGHVFSRFSQSDEIADETTPWAIHYTTENKPTAGDADAASHRCNFASGLGVNRAITGDTLPTAPGVWQVNSSTWTPASYGSLLVTTNRVDELMTPGSGVFIHYLFISHSNARLFSATNVNGTFSGWQSVYDTGHKPTAADVGAAPAVHAHAIADVSGLQEVLDGKSPTGHTHTAAQGNADIVAASHGQVGTCLFLWWNNPAATNAETLVAGAELAYADGEGNHAGALVGTWKQLGYRAVPAADNFGSMSTLFIRVA